MNIIIDVFARLRTFMDLSPDEIRASHIQTVDTAKEISSTSDIVENTIRNVTTEWLSASSNEDLKSRVDLTTRHVDETIQEATQVFASLKKELELQSYKLDELTKEIEVKTEKANYWSSLANVNETTLRGFTLELERRLRIALEQQQQVVGKEQARLKLEEERKQKREKRLGMIIDFAKFWITLILGTLLGFIFQTYLQRFLPIIKFP